MISQRRGKTSAVDMLSEWLNLKLNGWLPKWKKFPLYQILCFPEIPVLFSVTGKTPINIIKAMASSMEQQHKLFEITDPKGLIYSQDRM